MALTTEQIHAAADTLDAEGVRPTLAAVRKRLGAGSFTTISEAMSSWRSARNAAAAVKAGEPVPDDVAERGEVLVQEVWAAAQTAAASRVAAERDELAAARAELEAVRDEAIALADTLTVELDQSHAAAKAEIADLAGRLATARTDAEIAQAELAAARHAEQQAQVANAKIAGQLETLTAERDRLAQELAAANKHIGALETAAAKPQ